MKQKYIIKKNLIILLMAVTLSTGCQSQTSEPKSSETITQIPESTPEPTIDTEIHTDNLMGIYIGENQSQIGLGLDNAMIKEILGKADEIEKTKGGKNETDGSKKSATQSWYYKDLDTTITFEKANGTYTVSSIEGGKYATTLKTGGGITAGSSRKDIVTAYKEQLGADANTSKNKIVIDNMGYSRLVFTLKKDKVVSICMELSEI